MNNSSSGTGIVNYAEKCVLCGASINPIADLEEIIKQIEEYARMRCVSIFIEHCVNCSRPVVPRSEQ